jgi:hypothetical protein
MTGVALLVTTPSAILKILHFRLLLLTAYAGTMVMISGVEKVKRLIGLVVMLNPLQERL